jgi:hypothetical protein
MAVNTAPVIAQGLRSVCPIVLKDPAAAILKPQVWAEAVYGLGGAH